jgi:RNA polymerase-interacting CarD/CdnL/TRCF family regulator
VTEEARGFVVHRTLDASSSRWSQRYKVTMERLRSGDAGKTAEVVAVLSDRPKTVGLSHGEKRTLARANAVLDQLDSSA